MAQCLITKNSKYNPIIFEAPELDGCGLIYLYGDTESEDQFSSYGVDNIYERNKIFSVRRMLDSKVNSYCDSRRTYDCDKYYYSKGIIFDTDGRIISLIVREDNVLKLIISYDINDSNENHLIKSAKRNKFNDCDIIRMERNQICSLFQTLINPNMNDYSNEVQLQLSSEFIESFKESNCFREIKLPENLPSNNLNLFYNAYKYMQYE